MFSELAYAEGAGPQAGAPAFLQGLLVPVAIIFALAYFLLIRPQQEQEKKHREMLANLKRNDEVVTTGGLHGRVRALADSVLTVEIAPNVQVRIARSQVKELLKMPGGQEKERRREKEKGNG